MTELTFEAHDDGSPQGWDAALREEGGVVFHSEAWARHKTHGGTGDPVFCVWRHRVGGGVAGRALAIRRPPGSSRAGKVVSKLVFDAPPATAFRGGADFVAPLQGWARGRRSLVEVGLGTFDAITDWAPVGLPHPRARTEYVLPPGGEEEVWSGMRDLARRKVKKASKGGLECRAVGDRAELDAFAAIYDTTMARLTATKGVPETNLDQGRYAGSLAALFEGGGGALYAAFRDDVMVAGTVFANFGDRAYLVYTGATDAGRDEGAPFLVLFTALKELRAGGYANINLGGAAGDAPDPESSDHGLHQFKTRFGATAEERTSGTLILRPLRAKAVEKVRELVRR